MPDDVKSCRTCPSFLGTGAEVHNKFGRSVGSPMCGRFGTVLGKPGLPDRQEQELQKHVANRCDKYGEPLPGAPARDHYVMLPDPRLREDIDESRKTAVTSCAMCRSFVNEERVGAETGWSAGLCAAKGKLIMGHRMSFEATLCQFRQFGSSIGTTTGLMFLPEYQDAFTSGVADPVTQHFLDKAHFVDPTDYPTDREVSAEDEQAGIRAWRRVPDPLGSGNEVFLPIYRRDFFSPEEQELIPNTGDDEHPELYVDHFGGTYGLAVAWLELDETPMLSGPPGVGKTELYRYMAWLMQMPFRRISIKSSTELDEIEGKMVFENGQTKYKYGRLPLAWGSPGVLCVDEPNTARDPAVWHFLRPLTDNSKQLVIDANEGERIDRHDDCYMGLAINPAWDIKNVGAMEIGDADVRRLFHTYIDLPPEPLERDIIQSRVKLDGWELTQDQLNSLMGTARDIRALVAEQDALPITWGIAQQIKVARALRWFSPILAYRRAVADFLDPQNQQTLLDQVRAHWTDESAPTFDPDDPFNPF